MGCYIWYSEERPGRAVVPSSHLLAVPNVSTARPSTASVATSYYSMWHNDCYCTQKGSTGGLTLFRRHITISLKSINIYCESVRHLKWCDLFQVKIIHNALQPTRLQRSLKCSIPRRLTFLCHAMQIFLLTL